MMIDEDGLIDFTDLMTRLLYAHNRALDAHLDEVASDLWSAFRAVQEALAAYKRTKEQ